MAKGKAPQYALVFFTLEKEYSVIKTEWIQDFDHEDFSDNNVYAIEWREGRKPPAGGYPFYDGLVIQLSDSRSYLDKVIDGKDSPRSRRSLPKSNDEPHLSPYKRPATAGNSPKASKKLMRAHDYRKGLDTNQAYETLPMKQAYEELCNSLMEKLNSMETKMTTMDKNINLLMESTESLKKKLDVVYVESKKPKPKSKSPEPSKSEMETLGYSKTVLIDSKTLKDAKNAMTISSFGINLMRAMFPEDVLLMSNVKGGKAKNKKKNNEEEEEAFDALDASIMEAIRDGIIHEEKGNAEDAEVEIKCIFSAAGSASLEEAVAKKKIRALIYVKRDRNND